ncbi:MAG: chitin deacetylase family protein [Cyanobacteria bacterium J06631_9]
MKRVLKKWRYGAIALILLLIVHFLSQPRWLFSLATKIRPGAIYAVSLPAVSSSEYEDAIPEKVVALTIDDGPSPATADILAVIDRHGAKATFFNISSNLAGREDVVRQVVASGHELGNHLTADEPSIRMSSEVFEADLKTAEAALLPFLSAGSLQRSSLKWLRPGMGFYNAEMVATAERHGYQVVLGSNFPYDTHIPSSQFASTFILSTVEPGDIIVLHDGEGRGDRTIETLEKILPALKEKGYTVTTVSGLHDF